MDTSIRTKELPMTVPKIPKTAQPITRARLKRTKKEKSRVVYVLSSSWRQLQREQLGSMLETLQSKILSAAVNVFLYFTLNKFKGTLKHS